jgi:hypothetical protein
MLEPSKFLGKFPDNQMKSILDYLSESMWFGEKSLTTRLRII